MIAGRLRAWEIEIHSSVGGVRDISRAKRGIFFQFTSVQLENCMRVRAFSARSAGFFSSQFTSVLFEDCIEIWQFRRWFEFQFTTGRMVWIHQLLPSQYRYQFTINSRFQFTDKNFQFTVDNSWFQFTRREFEFTANHSWFQFTRRDNFNLPSTTNDFNLPDERISISVEFQFTVDH